MSVKLVQREIEATTFMKMAANVERRKHRRHDLEDRDYVVERWDAACNKGMAFGTVQDISAGGIRIRSRDASVTADSHIRLRLKLPTYAGISPFIRHEAHPEPTNDWTGWMVVSRVSKNADGTLDIAGRLIDMDEVDRGMLGLYLSTQPMAA